MDFNRLRLKYHGDPAKMEEILQMECREKTAVKLEDTLRWEGFRFPSTALAEMSTSDAVAEVHASLVNEGETVLDMTCGLGIDAFHIARRGCRVTAVELDPHAAAVAADNARVMGLERVETVCADSVEWLRGNDRRFDVIFIDPARRDNKGRHVALAQCAPDVTACISLLTDRAERVIIKCSPMLDMKNVAQELGLTPDFIVIGSRRECKELVALIPGSGKVTAITLGEPQFSFTPNEERCAAPMYATPAAGEILLEPYPAVMKSGGMKTLAVRHDVAKLNPSTHLYSSPAPVEGFPGYQAEIIEVLEFNRRTIKEFSRRYPQVNVAVRNFPLQAPALAARLKIKEGGELIVYGTTGHNGEHLLIVTRRITIS